MSSGKEHQVRDSSVVVRPSPAVLYREDSFHAADGLRLHVRTWLPPGGWRMAMVLVHGLTEHGGRYADFAAELNRHGGAVYALDLRGHGRSEGRRAAIRRFEQYLDDLEAFLGQVRSQTPDTPLFLFGHSMGGAIVTWLAIARQPPIQGLIVSAAALRVSGGLCPLLRRLAPLGSLLAPWLRLVRLGSSMLSRDARAVREFRDDPLVFHGRLTTRIGAEIFRAGSRIRGRMEEVRLPLLVLHGTADALTDPEGSRELYLHASTPDKTLRLYDGFYHDLLHDVDKDRVVTDIVAWLEARVGSRK